MDYKWPSKYGLKFAELVHSFILCLACLARRCPNVVMGGPQRQGAGVALASAAAAASAVLSRGAGAVVPGGGGGRARVVEAHLVR